jgi:hypothetical protein
MLATGCIVSVEPETAVNPVGTEHTVTATIGDPDDVLEDPEAFICDFLEELTGDPEICFFEQAQQQQFPSDDYITFEVISGPNTGTHSDGDCKPSCNPVGTEPVSWTYESNGGTGTDVIEVCSQLMALQLESFIESIFDEFGEELELEGITEEEFRAALLDTINDLPGQDFVSFDDLYCDRVTKTWVGQEDRRPNIGAGLSGLFQGQPTPLPTAAAPAAPSPVIRPPSTGNAGLAD